MRFGLTAQTIARDRALGREHTDITLKNLAKVTAFRKDGQQRMEDMVKRIESVDKRGVSVPAEKLMKQKVYKGARNRWFYGQTRMNEDTVDDGLVEEQGQAV